MREKIILLGLACIGLGLTACSESTSTDKKGWKVQEVNGRLQQPIYIVNIPSTWKRLEPTPSSLEDTRIPLATYLYSENNQTFTITIHNFPLKDLQDQIPAYAQVERWKRQFESLEPNETDWVKVSFAGYTGLYFKGIGKYKGEHSMMLAWSLVISPEGFRAMSAPDSPALKEMYDQMKADVTIKALGPYEIMAKHQDEIEKFVSSFHMLQEIPSE